MALGYKINGIMKYLILIISVIFFLSCEKEGCENTIIPITSLEKEYGCVNTKYQMDIDLQEDYTIIHTQSSFENLVIGNCQPQIDFSKYDLIIGKKGLGSGNASIDYELVENCEDKRLILTVIFYQTIFDEAPNLTYHALVPKIEKDRDLEVDIKIVEE